MKMLGGGGSRNDLNSVEKRILSLTLLLFGAGIAQSA
jgi:hypothetical protein